MNTSNGMDEKCLALRRASDNAKTITDVEVWLGQILDNATKDGRRTVSPETEKKALSELLTIWNLRETGGRDDLPSVLRWAQDTKETVEYELDRDLCVVMARDRLEQMQREVFLSRFDRHHPDLTTPGPRAKCRTWIAEDEVAWSIRSDPYLHTFLSYSWEEVDEALSYEETKAKYLNAKHAKDLKKEYDVDRKWRMLPDTGGERIRAARYDAAMPFADFFKRLLALSQEWDYIYLRENIRTYAVGKAPSCYCDLDVVASRGHFAKLASFLAKDLAELARTPTTCQELAKSVRVSIMEEVDRYFEHWEWDTFLNCLDNFIPKSIEDILELDDWSTTSELGELVVFPGDKDLRRKH